MRFNIVNDAINFDGGEFVCGVAGINGYVVALLDISCSCACCSRCCRGGLGGGDGIEGIWNGLRSGHEAIKGKVGWGGGCGRGWWGEWWLL